MSYASIERLLDLQRSTTPHTTVEIPSKKTQPPLNGLWGMAAADFLMVTEGCPAEHEIACGSALISPSKAFSELFGTDNQDQRFIATIVLDETEGEEVKEAHIIARASGVIVAFSIESDNGRIPQRTITQTILKGGDIIVNEARNEESLVWEDYLTVAAAIQQVQSWENANACSSCPVNNLDINLDGQL